ncbi:MAG: glycoside hydrolase family 97 protein [Bacteroidota bacterium]|nr:MAG: glycoside hydrolase family 97 protein [Bacteroidota bacterium]
MKTRFVLYLPLLVFLFLSCSKGNNTAMVQSPDGAIQLEFFLDSDGKPTYRVHFNQTLVIDTSHLGFCLKDQPELAANLKLVAKNSGTTDETWENVWGEQRMVRNNYNSLQVDLQEETPPFRKFSVVFKVYNDGLGFRYEFPKQDSLTEVVIMDENTEFNLTGNHMSWWGPGDWEIYEHLYTQSRLSEIDAGAKRNNSLAQSYIPDSNAVNTPFTLKTDEGIYLSFHEANLTRYASMTLHLDKETYTLKSALVAWEDGSKVKTTTPFVSPWRTIQIAGSAGNLIESNLIVNLNEPNKLENTSWIKPMKYMGVWWEMHLGVSTWNYSSGQHGANTENVKRYIDFASTNGFNAVLVEGWNTGWENWIGDQREGIFDWITPYPDFNIDVVVNYAREKNIRIIGHHETSGDVGNYDRLLDTAMAFYHSKGIGAVKTGYVGTLIPPKIYHHGQWAVEHYQRVVETAAKYNIAIVGHEIIKATGIRRTYPNMMAREVFRGQEFDAWSDGNPPNHATIIPFTCMLGGPIDYTPGIFNIKLKKLPAGKTFWEVKDNLESYESNKPNNKVSTTLAKQLSLYVVFYSPVQMAADFPEVYEGHPAFQFIRDVPVDWEQTKVLDGEIGEFVVIARQQRESENWFVGGLTNQLARKVQIDFSFLPANKKYRLTAYTDGADAHWDKNPISFSIQNFEVDNQSKMEFNMAEGGGFALSLMPK